MIGSPNCFCGQSETISHIMLHCPMYNQNRNQLRNKLSALGVSINLKNLLGGGDFDCPTQKAIVENVVSYLRNIGKLYRM